MASIPATAPPESATAERGGARARAASPETRTLGALIGTVLGYLPVSVEAADVDELFRKISPSVVVIRPGAEK